MHPGAGELLAPGMRAALGDFVFVMGENEIDRSSMNVEHVAPELLSDKIERHGRAFEVPPGAAAAEWRIPCGADALVIVARGFPENEVARVLLGIFVGVHTPACTGAQFAAIEL